jgi:hypothetical protein
MHFASLEFDYEHGEGVTYTITATGGLNDDPTYNAEYVDVEYDGIHRTTGSSMDLGSFSFAGSMRGPGSLTGSMGRSPRSPLRSPLLPRSPLGGPSANPGGFEQLPDLALRVGSAPAVSAGASAAAAALAGRSGSSRLRPGGAAAGSGFRAVNGSARAAATAAAGGGVADGVNDDSGRVAAGQHLSSFSVRVSNETGSDSGDGPAEDGPGPAGPSDGPDSAGLGSGSETLPLLSNSGGGASSSDAGPGNSSGGGGGSSRRGGRGRQGGKGKGKK